METIQAMMIKVLELSLGLFVISLCRFACSHAPAWERIDAESVYFRYGTCAWNALELETGTFACIHDVVYDCSWLRIQNLRFQTRTQG
uniref:Uncharacterized protein n=1 Tax=Candidatus Kentrum sp. SD TaxID=2126332 RepID=A0A451BPG0_9GAMM|nr:MAG: hypothetical protein BECKSD772D_GA0070982_10912 [Candidatus Kentron sp. SD]